MSASRLVLIGPSGVGKTLLGTRLAMRLNRTLFDVDQDVEERAGVDISWIFDKEGEAGFRVREHAALQRGLMLAGGVVIATGAGIVTTPACYQLLAAPGHRVIYLAASVALLYRRLQRSSNRPMLGDAQGASRRQKIEQILAARAPLYEQLADYRIDCDNQSINQLLNTITKYA